MAITLDTRAVLLGLLLIISVTVFVLVGVRSPDPIGSEVIKALEQNESSAEVLSTDPSPFVQPLASSDPGLMPTATAKAAVIPNPKPKPKPTSQTTQIQSTGAQRSEPRKYMVTYHNYYDYFANNTVESCIDTQQSLCYDCTKSCPCVKMVTLSELKQMCPPVVHRSPTNGPIIVTQAANGKSGSTWQFRFLDVLLRVANVSFGGSMLIEKDKGAAGFRGLKTRGTMDYLLFKTHIIYNSELEQTDVDIIFTTFLTQALCNRTHPNGYRKKTCKCCFSNFATRRDRNVRVAEFMMAASSLDLDVEKIDFEMVYAKMFLWYYGKYGKSIATPQPRAWKTENETLAALRNRYRKPAASSPKPVATIAPTTVRLPRR